MATDREILAFVREAFAAEPRPPHFTDYAHCCECAEHNDLLASRDLQSLRLEDVNNAGWDPICFVTSEGFRYYLPALARLALESSDTTEWYLPQMLFHLIGDGPRNRRVACCEASQREAVVALLWHVLETRGELIVEYGVEDDLQRAIEIWADEVA